VRGIGEAGCRAKGRRSSEQRAPEINRGGGQLMERVGGRALKRSSDSRLAEPANLRIDSVSLGLMRLSSRK
jgi:hypothetical protein